MKISTSNFTTVPDKGLCDCPIRLYESPLTGKRVSIRPLNELETVIFPSGVIGGRGQFNSARAFIERIDGVIAVSLIFCQTAVRVLFDAHRTGPEAIDNALNTMVSADNEKPEITRRYCHNKVIAPNIIPMRFKGETR